MTSLCDLVKTVMDWLKDSDNVPNYQLMSPIVLLISAVSVRVCACVRVCGWCVVYMPFVYLHMPM